MEINDQQKEQSPSASRERQRRSSSRSSRSRPSWQQLLLTNQLVLDRLVLAMFALTLVAAAYLFRQDRTHYPEIWLGATPSEAKYGFGEPQNIRQIGDRTRWEYQGQGGTRFVDFASDRAVTVGCHAQGSRCPSMLGLSTDSTEFEVMGRLGLPTSQAIVNGTKRMRYADLGLEFELRKFQVQGIYLHEERSSLLGTLARFGIFLLP